MIERLRRLRFLWVGFCIVGMLILLFQLMGIRLNLTGSMPIGFYQRCHDTHIKRGDIVTACLPKAIALLGKKQGYLGSGSCPGQVMPLLKQVIALPGDRILLSASSIRVNGVRYLAPQQALDDRHQPIKHWVKNGVYKETKKVWLYGSKDPMRSWDSRYFGGISIENICGIYKPLWVF